MMKVVIESDYVMYLSVWNKGLSLFDADKDQQESHEVRNHTMSL